MLYEKHNEFKYILKYNDIFIYSIALVFFLHIILASQKHR